MIIIGTLQGRIVLGIQNRVCRVQVAEIIQREEASLCVTSRNIRKPKAIIIQRKFNVMTSGICIRVPVLLCNHHRNEPFVKLTSGRTLVPREGKRINTQRNLLSAQSILHHSGNQTAARLVNCAIKGYLRIGIPVVYTPKINIHTVGTRFPCPIQHHR